MDIKTITRRLDALQQLADQNKPCSIVIKFADGSSITTDPAGAIGIFRERGLSGDITAFSPDKPEYDGLCSVLSVLCHPAQNSEANAFE